MPDSERSFCPTHFRPFSHTPKLIDHIFHQIPGFPDIVLNPHGDIRNSASVLGKNIPDYDRQVILNILTNMANYLRIASFDWLTYHPTEEEYYFFRLDGAKAEAEPRLATWQLDYRSRGKVLRDLAIIGLVARKYSTPSFYDF